jgi:hypothetical protein
MAPLWADALLPAVLAVLASLETLLAAVPVPDAAVDAVVSLEADAPAAGAAPDERAADADAGVSVGAATLTETDAACAPGDTGLLIASGGLADTGGAGAALGTEALVGVRGAAVGAGRGAVVGAGTAVGDGGGAAVTMTGMPGRCGRGSVPLLSVSPVPCPTGETARTFEPAAAGARAVWFSTGLSSGT